MSKIEALAEGLARETKLNTLGDLLDAFREQNPEVHRVYRISINYYGVLSRKCKAQYVGITSMSITDRIEQHKRVQDDVGKMMTENLSYSWEEIYASTDRHSARSEEIRAIQQLPNPINKNDLTLEQSIRQNTRLKPCRW